ncbi:MAG: pseudouridine synthase [Corynebacterium sp.]|nr:pseudouridine synthase [Corynebacterium sp.]
MAERIIRRRQPPLPVRDGLNPSRVQLPRDAEPITARDFILHLVRTQTHKSPEDNEASVDERFARGEVMDPRGRRYAPDELIQPGADVWFYRKPGPERHIPFDIPILFQDENLLVADKPAFLATMPRGRHITETATVRLRRATGNQDLSPAHRLDRLTSGVLVFTTRPEVRGAYQDIFAERRAHKTYEAIAPYNANIAPGTVWENRIEKIRGIVQAKIIDGAPNALTEVVNVERLPDGVYARYTLAPKTGRTHQLRLHMNAAGAPILGDPLYPELLPLADECFSNPLRLLARELSFRDPFTGEMRVFRSQRTLSPEPSQ